MNTIDEPVVSHLTSFSEHVDSRQSRDCFRFQLLTGAKSITDLYREHQVRSGLVYRWRDEFMAHGSFCD